MRGNEALKFGLKRPHALQWIAFAICMLLACEAAAATSGYTITSASSVRFYVDNAPWADLHYQVNSGVQLNVRMTANGSNHIYDVTGIPSGAVIRYFFTIGSFSGGATDTAWSQFSMSGGSTAPSAPTNLTASTASSSQINLSWTASSGTGVSYTLYRSTTSGFTPSSSNQIASGVTATTYSNTGLTAATTYYYIVRAANAAGTSGNSNQASATTAASSGGWTVVWEDTFSGSGQPNPANWNYHVGNGFNPGLNNFQGWGNGEWEWYRPENTYVQNGNLVIRADYNDTPTNIAGRNWYQHSGRITTKGKHSWTYGRIEARIAMPSAIGTWPAFWMMGSACDDTYTSNYNAPINYYDVMASNWSSCGEIDIMEHRNTETVTFQNLFWDSRVGLYPWANGMNNEQPNSATAGNVTQFHLYTIEWDATQIRWYIDRETNPTPVHTVNITTNNKEEFHKPFYIILNLALSGIFTGYAEPNKADFPMYMYVDYVRVWKKQ